MALSSVKLVLSEILRIFKSHVKELRLILRAKENLGLGKHLGTAKSL